MENKVRASFASFFNLFGLLINLLAASQLAHVNNLGTQALIGTYSKSPHYSPHNPKAHEPDISPTGDRDEIGLIHTICVKVRLFSHASNTPFILHFLGTFICKT